MKISSFFKTRYCNFASYDNLRKIGSMVDGLKNSSRKVVFVAKKYNLSDDIKISAFANDVARQSNYIHGPTILEGVITGMTQRFCGANNLSFFDPQSSFGTRLTPDASSPRYIFIRGTNTFDLIYNKEDDFLLPNQVLEGMEVEPKFYIPIIPMFFVNGLMGTTPGFKQQIIQRDPKKIISFLKDYCNDKQSKVSWRVPYYNGFNGDIIQGDNPKQWLVRGKCEIKNTTTVEVTEIPVPYTQKKYYDILNDLEDRKIISSFQDLCDTKKDIPLFVVKFERKKLEGLSIEDLIKLLKLQVTVSETLFAYNENNMIEEFEDVETIMQRYILIREHYYHLRKANQLERLEYDLNVLNNRLEFIKFNLKDGFKISNLTDSEIDALLSGLNLMKIDGSYDYLLSMPIRTITKEKIDSLEKQIIKKQTEYDTLSKMDIKSIWLEDLKELERRL